MAFLESFSSTLPIILMILFGVFLRKRSFFGETTIQEIKKLVVNVSLPLVLLNAFAVMAFELRYLWIIITIFLGCVVVMFSSRYLEKIIQIPSHFFPFLMAGFEAGMMGYAIFGSVYGVENIPKFAIMDLGQVLFVFLVLIPTLENGGDRRMDLKAVGALFLKSPVIIAIFCGILLNISGLYSIFARFPISNALIQTTSVLGSVTIPLVAIVLGYDLNLKLSTIGKPLKTVAIRMTVWVVFGFLFNFFIIRQMLGLDTIYQAAVWVLLVLPPPFVIPLFMTQSNESDRNYIANTLSLSTLVSLLSVVVIRFLILPIR